MAEASAAEAGTVLLLDVEEVLVEERFIMSIQAELEVHCRHGLPEGSSTTPEARRT